MIGHPPDLVEAVIAQYGKMRAQDVAAQFGLSSRAAVIAIWYRARRAGTIEKIAPQRKADSSSNQQDRKSKVAVSLRKHDPDPEPRLSRQVAEASIVRECSIFDLNFMSCRWIVRGSGVHSIFCGQPKDGVRPYCAEHALRAYGRATVPEDEDA